MMEMIKVMNLKKKYDDFEAVRGIDFNVNEGEVFGLLGPNGAGKTTTVEILEGLIEPSSGTATIANLDVVKDSKSDSIISRLNANPAIFKALKSFSFELKFIKTVNTVPTPQKI